MSAILKALNEAPSVNRARMTVERAPTIWLSAAAIMAFVPLKVMLIGGEHVAPVARIPLLALICLIALGLSSIGTSDLPKPLRLVLRGIVGLLVGYVIWTEIPVRSAELEMRQLLEAWLYSWGAAAFGAAAWWRLSWAIPFFVAAKWQKALVSEVLGIGVSPTDYTPLIEFGLLVSLGGLIFILGRRWFGLWNHARGEQSARPLEFVLLTAVAVHFANYFYSGLQKLRLGDSLLQWVNDNPTHYLTLAAWEAGALPTTLLGPEMAGWIYEWQVKLNVPLNASILIVQLLALFAILRTRWAMRVESQVLAVLVSLIPSLRKSLSHPPAHAFCIRCSALAETWC